MSDYLTLIADAALVGRWNGDANGDTTGDAGDVLGVRNGTWIGAAAYGTPPDRRSSGGKSLVFNGAKGINVGDVTCPSAFTVGAWINVSSLAANGQIVAAYDGGTANEAWLQFAVRTDGSLRFAVHQTRDTVRIGRTTAAGLIIVGNWVHVCATWDGTTAATGLRVYINGVRVDTTNDNAGTFTAKYANPANVTIGCQLINASVDTGFNGQIFDPQIYSRAFTQLEVTALAMGLLPNYLFLGSVSDTSDLATYTFAGLPAGDAYLIEGRSTGGSVVSSVTVDGVPASIKAAAGAASGTITSVTIATAAPPSNPTATVVVTFASGQVRCYIQSIKTAGLDMAVKIDDLGAATESAAGSVSGVIDCPTNGLVIAGAVLNTSVAATDTWTGLVELYGDVMIENVRPTIAAQVFTAAQVNLAIGVAWTFSSGNAWAAASFGPPVIATPARRGPLDLRHSLNLNLAG